MENIAQNIFVFYNFFMLLLQYESWYNEIDMA